MRIFIAGGTGAVGIRTVPLLVAARHEVYGSTRHAAGCEALAEQVGGRNPMRLPACSPGR
ncbi:hypothetical protein ACFVJS_21455 [Nocardioides sp. NPDC057772]|uniref:hypothetical protein n=1 Tax=Nocardioides sp. NPDC057772 TaxID=3346245 RepID=UPI00366C72BA